MRRTDRITDALRGRKKVVAYAGVAAALLGTGTASAATVAATSHSAPVKATSTVRAGVRTTARPGRGVTDLAAAAHALPQATATHASMTHGAVKHAATKPAAVANLHTWAGAEAKAASQTSPSEPKAANQLQPVGTTGAQAWMQLSGSQLANAKTIVEQALAKKMGVRSAVIGVATAMQESMLQNINYGDRDSLGLFQQRPSCGWGSAQQILDPKFSADAFLTALKTHQTNDSGWVHQPLWANAQAVQASGLPFAYAKWETQAAHLVKQFVTEMR